MLQRTKRPKETDRLLSDKKDQDLVEIQMHPLEEANSLSPALNFQSGLLPASAAKQNNETKANVTSLDLLTFNTATFPKYITICGCIRFQIRQINGDVLPPNDIRIPIIKEKIAELNPHVFALQEVWDKDVAKDYIKFFGERGYNCTHLGFGWFILKGGVMQFSRLPKIDSKEIVFKNPSFPVEWFGGKGAVAAHYKVGNGFITVGSFHQPGGDSSNCEAKTTGTSSYRRGQNFGHMLTEFIGHDWWQNPGTNTNCLMNFINAICNLFSCCRNQPPNYGPYKGGVMTGDHNISMDSKRIQVETEQGPKTFTDNRKHLSVSEGLGNNGFNEGEIKYGSYDPKTGKKTGQYGYADKMIYSQPTNFIDPRDDVPKAKGDGRHPVDAKILKAIDENLSTGTDRAELKDITVAGKTIKGTSFQAAKRLIDGMGITKDCADKCDLQTVIISVDGVDEAKNAIALSDHQPLKGTLTLGQPSKEPPSIYEGSIPQPTNRRDPSEGCWQRFKRVLTCASSPALFTLKPVVEVKTSSQQRNTLKATV